jgi:hypothetical protein
VVSIRTVCLRVILGTVLARPGSGASTGAEEAADPPAELDAAPAAGGLCRSQAANDKPTTSRAQAAPVRAKKSLMPSPTFTCGHYPRTTPRRQTPRASEPRRPLLVLQFTRLAD